MSNSAVSAPASFARVSIAALSIALLLSLMDAGVASTHPLAALVAGVDVFTGVLAAGALHLALAALVALLGFALLRMRKRSRGAFGHGLQFLPTITFGLLAGALNLQLIAKRPLVLLAIATLVGLHFLFVLALVRSRRRRVALAGAWLIAVTCALVDGWMLRGSAPHQHETLVLAVWSFGTLAAYAGMGAVERAVGERRPGARMLVWLGWGGALVLVVQSALALAEAPAGARLVLQQTAAASASLRALGPLLELDGDGDPAWPVGGDCAPLDGAVSAVAMEIAGDGIDGNCFAGDPSREDVVALAGVLARVDAEAPPVDPADRILLLTVDALRHDARLPELERRIGHRCTKYPEARSTNPETTYAVHSLFTSRFPSQGVFSDVGAFHVPIDDPAPRLAALLGHAGYATMAVAFHNRFDPRLGLTQGFDSVWTAEARAEVILDIAGPAITEHALGWLDGRRPPWFLWVHYYDPHEPYLTHPEVPPRNATPRAVYDAEVAYTDAHLGRLLDSFGAVLDEVAIVVTADHGEAFGEHGHFFHATDLFDEQIRIPLWVCPARGQPPAASLRTASLVDVAPTLLELAGVARPSTFTGGSLLHHAEAPAFAETIRGRRMRAVVAWPWKLIQYLDGDVRLLFDVQSDPGERTDRFGARDAELRDIERSLDAWSALDVP